MIQGLVRMCPPLLRGSGLLMPLILLCTCGGDEEEGGSPTATAPTEEGIDAAVRAGALTSQALQGAGEILQVLGPVTREPETASALLAARQALQLDFGGCIEAELQGWELEVRLQPGCRGPGGKLVEGTFRVSAHLVQGAVQLRLDLDEVRVDGQRLTGHLTVGLELGWDRADLHLESDLGWENGTFQTRSTFSGSVGLDLTEGLTLEGTGSHDDGERRGSFALEGYHIAPGSCHADSGTFRVQLAGLPETVVTWNETTPQHGLVWVQVGDGPAVVHPLLPSPSCWLVQR